MKLQLPHPGQPRIVIIGGGYGGITLAQQLSKLPVQVVMMDKNNYHTFQPLLYQVATGGLEPDSIAFPLRKLFDRQRNFFFRMAEVQRIDTAAQLVITDIGEIEYDYLVLATGTVTNFFGMEEVATHALGMKNIPEALDLRSLILQHIEQANREPDPELQRRLLTFVAVGGGPTGVETAGALAELKRHILPKDYPELEPGLMQIYLLEAGPRLLPTMSEASSADALKALQALGAQVLLNARVTGYNGEAVSIAGGESPIPAATMIWSAGVTGAMVGGLPAAALQRGRLLTDAFNRVQGLEDVFAIGDIALMQHETAWPQGHPQVAPAAIQQGAALAANFRRLLAGEELKPFVYFDKGSMATIGRNKAVVDFRKLHIRGFMAWMAWMFVHLLFLAGFRNKTVVFINWVWSYFTYDKGARLIIRPFRKKVVV